MNFELPNFSLIIPEIFLLTMICAILLLDLFLTDKQRIVTYYLSQLALVVTASLVFFYHTSVVIVDFSGHFIQDPLSDLLKIFLCGIVVVVFLYSKDYLKQVNLLKGEFFILGLFGVLGMLIMISAHSFLMLYLGLELLSLSLYALVALNRDSQLASEAAMKYFILGALASGLLLYGMSMLYGMTGSLELASISEQISKSDNNSIVLIFGLVFIIVGIGFKLGAVPFHMWVPDVYEGAPTAVTLYIGSATKIAALALALRLLVDGLIELHHDWQGMLVVLAVLSLAVGNIVAIAQTNIKRMLAYSTISHIGFVLLAILAGTIDGYIAATFYTLAYTIMAVGAFGVVIILNAENLTDFQGLNEQHPWLALMMLLFMFSMAGVPPTVGFYAKLMVISAIISVDLTWLAVIAVLFSVIGVFYYLRIVKIMYFDKLEDCTQVVKLATDMKWSISLNGLAILALGLYPSALMVLCTQAFVMSS